MESVSNPLDLVGRTVGPVDVAITADRVSLYVDTTGDDSSRWSEQAPPGFASVLLFSVADEFLYHRDVIAYTATLLHRDQSFTYRPPMRIAATLHVEGTVARVRERAGSFFVTFDVHASDDSGRVMESKSTFVLSDRTAPPPESIRPEPPVRERGTNEAGERSASRHDLIRYAAGTRDFNPLHWDHAFAVDSGLPGTVVHGLLMYAWMVEQASSTAGGRDVASAKIRFRSALHPAQQAVIETTVVRDTVSVALSCGADQLVTGSVTLVAQGE
jgi:acyl dehydratase